VKWLTGPLTRSRREAIALAAREQINAGVLRLQRNAYRDHTRRMIAATAKVNEVWAKPPAPPHAAPWSPSETAAVQAALGELTALCLMAQAYDQTQTASDPTIQENAQ
jgi:hypothetical protein